MPILLLILLILMSLFLILIVLVQRGKGGGLAGALGGMGGQSAFGTKAGDTFTKVTMWTAFAWLLLCIVTVKYLGNSEPKMKGLGSGATPAQTPADGAGGLSPLGQDPAGDASGETTEDPAGETSPAGNTEPAAGEDAANTPSEPAGGDDPASP